MSIINIGKSVPRAQSLEAEAERARRMAGIAEAEPVPEQKQIVGRQFIRGDHVEGNRSRRVGWWEINTKPGTTLDKVKAVYLSSLNVADDSEAFGKQAQESGEFTDAGLKAAILGNATSKLAIQLKRNQQSLDRASRELADQRAKLAPPAPDPSDAAAAIRRWEFRQWFKGLDDRERTRYMMENRGKMPPEEAAALMEVPASRTGILEIDRNDLIDRAMRAVHGDLIDDVKALEAGIGLASAATNAARDQLAKDGGTTLAKFDELAAPSEAKASIPWLKMDGGKIYSMKS